MTLFPGRLVVELGGRLALAVNLETDDIGPRIVPDDIEAVSFLEHASVINLDH